MSSFDKTDTELLLISQTPWAPKGETHEIERQRNKKIKMPDIVLKSSQCTDVPNVSFSQMSWGLSCHHSGVDCVCQVTRVMWTLCVRLPQGFSLSIPPLAMSHPCRGPPATDGNHSWCFEGYWLQVNNKQARSWAALCDAVRTPFKQEQAFFIFPYNQWSISEKER